MVLEDVQPWVSLGVDLGFAGVLIWFTLKQHAREDRLAKMAVAQQARDERLAKLQEHSLLFTMSNEALHLGLDDAERQKLHPALESMRDRFRQLHAELGFALAPRD